jgi:hypothetical protein
MKQCENIKEIDKYLIFFFSNTHESCVPYNTTRVRSILLYINFIKIESQW